jgi:DNA repair protein RecO (recombination protein O)
MKQTADQAIVLGRIDYGEKDRILTLLTRKHGKVSVLAKSVRAQKSRLAGGTELLSTSEVTLLSGRGELYTLTGARLKRHFHNITKNMHRMNLAFDALIIVSKYSEEGGGQEYYQLLEELFAALNDETYDARLVWLWFGLHILDQLGALPEITADNSRDTRYDYDFDAQKFVASEEGKYSLNDLKLLKLSSIQPRPLRLQKTCGSEDELFGFVNLLLKTGVTEV